MSYGDKPFVPGQPVPVQPMPVQEPPTIASVTVRPDFFEPTPEPQTFFEEFKNTLGNIWYGSEESQRRGDVMLRGLAKAGTGLVDLASTAVQYAPPVAMVNALLSPEPTAADMAAGRKPARAIEIPNITQPVQQLMTEQGFAQAETPYQRGLQTVSEYVSPVGMLRQLPVKALQTAIPLQAAAATSGGIAESVARESGATPLEQTAAGIITSLGVTSTPALINQVKRLVSGGASPQQIQQVITDFERLGTTASVGQATGRTAQSTEQMLSNYPGGAGQMAQFGEKQQAAIGAKTEEIASELSGARSVKAGRSIESGAKAFRDASVGFRKDSKATQLYNEADNAIGQNHQVSLDNTTSALDELTAEIPFLPESSKATANKSTLTLAESLKADIESARLQGKVGIPYESIKAYRTRIGRLISDSLFNPDANTEQLRDLYRTLSLDIERSFASNPSALGKLKRADAYYRAAMNRLDDISGVINAAGGSEKVFMSAISGTKEGATTLTRIMRSLPLESRKDVTSAMLYRMGRAKGGVATSEDFADQFSTETFLTNYNNLSKEAKLVLFGQPGYGKTFIQDMNAIVKASQNLRESSKYFLNTSGTARQQQFNSLFGAVSSIPGFIAGGASESLAAGAITTGAAAVGSAVIANLSARLMTNPKFVRWLATTTKLPPKVGAAQVDLLAKANRDDEDIQQFAEVYKQSIAPTGGFGDPIYNPEAVEEQ